VPDHANGRLSVKETSNGVLLGVRLTPKAARDGVTGVENDADGTPLLCARVRALPEKGKANTALEALLADWLGVPKSSVEVISGGKSRLKRVLLSGDRHSLRQRLIERIADLDAGA